MKFGETPIQTILAVQAGDGKLVQGRVPPGGSCVEEASVGRPGAIARVVHVEAGGFRYHLEYQDGRSSTVTVQYPTELHVGCVVRVLENPDAIEHCPLELFRDSTYLAVVRRIDRESGTAVVQSAGTLRLARVPVGLALSDWNTVEVSTVAGVLRVVAEQPISTFDRAPPAELDAHRFRAEAEELDFTHFAGAPLTVARAKELVELAISKPDRLLNHGVRPPRGVLFSGPPGTGKTFLARIIASVTDAEFYVVQGPELLSKWYGESEHVLRELFEHAKGRDRAVVFFDEIDAIAPRRSDDTHEASRRVVTQLLTLLDGFTQQNNLLIIAATNRKDSLDPALVRDGRFDWKLEFDLPDAAQRTEIMLHTRPMAASSVCVARAVELTEGWSPAELVGVWRESIILMVLDGRDRMVEEDILGALARLGTKVGAR